MKSLTPATIALAFFLSAFAGCDRNAGSSSATENPKPPAQSLAKPFALVGSAQGLAKVVLPKDATPRNREATEELVRAVEKMSGAKLEVIKASPAEAPERAIWIGVQPGIESLFPGIDLSLTRPEEIRIVSTQNHLLIAGHDVYDPEHLTVEGRSEKIEGFQREYGTANAIYTFIQEPLGVRWLQPGPLGPDYPQSKDITIPATDVRYAPQFRERMGMFYGFDLGRGREGEIQDWARRQRMLLDSLDVDPGHPFSDWWEKYGKTNPELFALMPDGSRGTHPSEPRWKKLCDGEPKVADVWLREVAAELKKNPNLRVFSVAVNDGATSGVCLDPRSMALDPPITPDTPTFNVSYGPMGSRKFPALIDRHVAFGNMMARRLREEYPDEDFQVVQYAYGNPARMPPRQTKPDDNMIILAVHNIIFRGGSEREEHRNFLSGWGKIHDKIVWRPNTGSGAGWYWGTPDVPFRQIAEDFRFAAENGVMGIIIDTVWQHWATTGPLYYLMAQLAWNPFADADAVLEDFCKRAYGPAEKSMLEYWRLLEKTRNDLTAASPSRWRMMDATEFYTDEFFAKAYGLLDSAAKEAASGPEIYSKRVQFVRYGMDYTRHVIGIRRAMVRWEASKGKDEAARAEVDALWLKTDELRKIFPPFAIAWERVLRNDAPKKGQTRRMFGLHPETPLKPSFIQEWQDAKAGKVSNDDDLE